MSATSTVGIPSEAHSPSAPDWPERIQSRYGRRFRQLIRGSGNTTSSDERRSEPRISLEIPFLLYPAELDEEQVRLTTLQPIQAVAHDFSRSGLGFHYDEPFEDELAVAEFDAQVDGTVCCLIQLRWRQKKSRRHYLAGGSIIRWLIDEHVVPGQDK